MSRYGLVRGMTLAGMLGCLAMGGGRLRGQDGAVAEGPAVGVRAAGVVGAQTGSAGGAQAPAAGGGQQVQMGGMTPGVAGVERRVDRAVSTALTVTVEGRSRTFTVQELEAMPQRTVTVRNGHTQATETYAGVAVSDLLAAMGMSLAGDAHAPGSARSRLLRSYLRATGTDFYFAVYSAVELEGTMHAGEVIVATKKDGKGLGDAGALMLVSSEDTMPARWVRNLTSMTLTAVD